MDEDIPTLGNEVNKMRTSVKDQFGHTEDLFV